MPLEIIFHQKKMTYVQWLAGYTFVKSAGDKEAHDLFSQIASDFQTNYIEKVTGYQVNFETIRRDTSPDVVCTIFETINTTGAKLTVFDLLVAKCYKNSIKLKEKLATALESSKHLAAIDPNGELLAESQIPRIIGLLQNGQCKKGDILSLTPEQINNNWDKAVQGIERAMNLVYQELGGKSAALIPSTDIIAPMSAIMIHSSYRPEKHKELIKRWYWSNSLSQYLSQAPESKSAKMYAEWTKPDSGIFFNPNLIPEVISSLVFEETSLEDAGKNSAIYKATLAFIIASGAKDFSKDRKLLSQIKGKEIEEHHIFPRNFLSNYGIKGVEVNSILNRTPISGDANSRISSQAPHVYFDHPEIKGNSEFSEEELSKHFLSKQDFQLEFSIELFKGFLAKRRNRIFEAIHAAAKGTPNT